MFTRYLKSFSKINNFSSLSKFTQSRCFSLTPCVRTGFKHVDTPDNNPDTPWDFSPKSYEKVHQILKKYPRNRKRSAIIPLLHLAQEQHGGWIPLTAMRKVAQICEVPDRDVYEVMTFYSYFNRQPVGKYHIQVCVTTPCMLRGADEICEALQKHLGVGLNETTKDGLFTISEMECFGACVNAPMVAIADYSKAPEFSFDYYEDLTVESAIAIVESFKKGIKPPHGPQNGRKNAMGIQGKTTLLSPPRGPYCRELPKK